MMNNKWWKDKVVYQIYPRSFMDSNGDGTGDIQGIISKLDYLEHLGVEVLWLSPVYGSPNDDNGYDISDYYDIMPEFGTMKDMDELIEEAKKRNIGIVMDLVANHTSDEHAWFKDAVEKGEASPYYDYYIWRDGGPNGELPNDITSVFSGPAWTYNEKLGKYYLHQFSKKQPDLNWENESMRHDIYDMINWWLEKGIAGFRLDVIDLIGKIPDEKILANGPMLHPYIKEMSIASFQKHDAFTVGETWGATPESAMLYSNPDDSELSMVFQFEHITTGRENKSKWDTYDWEFKDFRNILVKWQEELADKGWNSLFLGNHDLPRSVSYFGDDSTEENRVLSAKMLATMMHGMQGTPYVYQGEEIGMVNVQFDTMDDYKDIEIHNMYKEATEGGKPHDEIMQGIYKNGRDNARTPMQWDDSTYAGFSDAEPWIKVNESKEHINVESDLNNPNSIFKHYKKLIQLRKDNPILVDGVFKNVEQENDNLFIYQRILNDKTWQVMVNASNSEQQIPVENQVDGKVILSNYHDVQKDMLRPYEAVIVEIE